MSYVYKKDKILSIIWMFILKNLLNRGIIFVIKLFKKNIPKYKNKTIKKFKLMIKVKIIII